MEQAILRFGGAWERSGSKASDEGPGCGGELKPLSTADSSGTGVRRFDFIQIVCSKPMLGRGMAAWYNLKNAKNAKGPMEG